MVLRSTGPFDFADSPHIEFTDFEPFKKTPDRLPIFLQEFSKSLSKLIVFDPALIDTLIPFEKVFGRSMPVPGKIAEKGGGKAPPGGRTYADGRFDPYAEKQLRVKGIKVNAATKKKETVYSPHKGIDLIAELGQTVTAPGAGKVVRAEYENTLGNLVVIELVTGFYARIAHLSEIEVSVGQKVLHGDRIGKAGNTGNAEGGPVHVHFEIRDAPRGIHAKAFDPEEWVKAAPTRSRL